MERQIKTTVYNMPKTIGEGETERRREEEWRQEGREEIKGRRERKEGKEYIASIDKDLE